MTTLCPDALLLFLLVQLAVRVQPCRLTVTPSVISLMTVGSRRDIQLNCTCCSRHASNGQVVMATVHTTNSHVASAVGSSLGEQRERCEAAATEGDSCGGWRDVPYPFLPGLAVEANNVGRATLRFRLTVWNATEQRPATPGTSVYLAEASLPVSTKRKWRLIDRVFELSAAFVACTLAMCMGCVTDFTELKPHFSRPLALVTCLVTQHAVMPPIAFGLYQLFKLRPEIGFGLVATSTMPGGGMAHLTVFLMSGDRNLSAAVSIINCLLNLCLSPAWIGVFTWHFKLDMHYYRLVLWLLPLCASQCLGAVLATCRPAGAQALLNWVGRPILLLSTILIVTLGIYINHYAIDHLDGGVMGCVLTFVGCGFCLGGLAGFLAKQGKPRRKAMAAEAACCACLIAIPALRYACPEPAGDLATIASLTTAILTPSPMLVYVVSHRVKCWVQAFIDKRREKQSRHYSIVSSLALMAESVAAVSTPLALDDSMRMPEEKQKVTTL